MTQPTSDPNRTYHYMKRWRYQGYHATIPALGSQRRIQALRAIGYTIPQLAEATGLSTVYLDQLCNGRRSVRINKRNAELIDRAYRTLSVQPLHNTTQATRSRNNARRRGWHPPMAWNDIDNPKERPRGTRWEKCAAKGCTRLAESAGLCDSHYWHLRKERAA